MDADRNILAALIAEHGPMHGSEIRGALQWPFGRLHSVARGHGWFAMTANGWDFTEQGRAANENGYC